ncbi:MAG: HD domain-containing protein [Pirellulales bacterium]
MQRQFIADLQPRDSVDEIYRVADKQIRANRQGNDYILLQLIDRTGQISGLRWNASTSIYESFLKGDFLRVIGTTQLHNGALQMIVQDFEPVPSEKVCLADFEKTNPDELKGLLYELRTKLQSVQNSFLQYLVAAYLDDEKLMSQLCRAPAGIKTHHAYEGGLLRHIVDLLRIADSIAPHYPQLDRDLLVIGVFLHDIGKLEELSFDGEMTYTDPGQLIGHLVQGVVQLDRKIVGIEKSTGQQFPELLAWRIQHMIVSHHGYLEHGSPKVPMTLEAIVLAYIDDLDAKINQATELINSDRNTDSDWTGFHPNLGRKLYKPSLFSKQ